MPNIETQQKELNVKKEIEDRHTGELVPLLLKAIKVLEEHHIFLLLDPSATLLSDWYNEHRIRKSMLTLETENTPFIFNLTKDKQVFFIKDYKVIGRGIICCIMHETIAAIQTYNNQAKDYFKEYEIGFEKHLLWNPLDNSAMFLFDMKTGRIILNEKNKTDKKLENVFAINVALCYSNI